MLLLAPAHVLQFGVQLLVGGKDASGHHGFCQHVRPESVLLLLVFLQVESLVPQQRAGSLDNGTEDAVKGSQHHYIEEEDADTQYERPEHRKDIYRLGTGKGLPHSVSHVEQRLPVRPVPSPYPSWQSLVIVSYRFLRIWYIFK